jgi:hypothetical protein
VRQNLSPGRMTLVSLACAAMLAACGGGGDGGNGEGRLQVINFAYPGGPGGATMAESRKLNATTTSGLPVTFASTTPSTCTVSGDMVDPVALGECRVVATQGGGTTDDGVKWAAADDVSQLFVVLKTGQSVAVVAPDYVFSSMVSEIALSAIATSGLPATLSGGTPGVCELNGNTLKLLGKGSCLVTATQAGDGNYVAATAMRPIAVDPLLVADGILGAGRGTTDSAMTKQGGAVKANPWSNLLGGWEWCDDNTPANGTCFRTVSADESTFTSALHISRKARDDLGWHFSFNNIDIFSPGLSGFNQAGDTTGGLQVTTEKVFAITLGVNDELFRAKKPLVVQLDLGKRNNGCNVTLSAPLWPAEAGPTSYGITLETFAVTEACGLAGVTATSLDDNVRKVPSPWLGATPAEREAAVKAYTDALAGFTPAREAAMVLLKSSNVIRTRVRLMDVNLDFAPAATPDLMKSEISIKGAITLQ